MQRESFEAQQMDVVTSAFNAELTSARSRISEAVGRAMKAFDSPRLGLVESSSLGVSVSFRTTWHFSLMGQFLRVPFVLGMKGVSFLAFGQDSADKFSVKVNVLAAADPDPSIKQKIDAIEHKRADQVVLVWECEFLQFTASVTGAGETYV